MPTKRKVTTRKSQTQTVEIKPYTIPKHKPDIIWNNKIKRYIVPDYSLHEIEVKECERREIDIYKERAEEELKKEWQIEQERRRNLSLPLC